MNKSKRILSLLLLFGAYFLFVSMPTQASKPSAVSSGVGTVTSYEKITWGISTGRYYVNGIHAFCAQYNKKWPTVGTEVTSISLSTNEVLRKVLYYGYNGPANTLGADARAHVLTAVAVSDANIGEAATGASSKYDVFYWEIVNNPSKYPSPPSNFKAYMAITSSDDFQNLAFYEMEKNGYVKAFKSSSNPELTNQNPCYSLAGAQYGLYNNISLSGDSRVGTLTMDASGNSNTVELSAGTYYAYEIVAPKGYAKSETVATFTITPEETTTLHLQDDPQTNPIEILLEKVDAQTGKNEPQGFATLQGAEFSVKFYAGMWEKDVDPATLGQSPTRTWTFATDEKGMVYYTEAYQVAGDALYKALPLGTLTIQETKASPGYLLNKTMFIRQITSEGIAANVSTYIRPVVEEIYDEPKPYDIVIHKSDLYDNMLCGAEFSLYSDAECEREVAEGTTGEEGILRLQDMEVGKKYYLTETKAPAGYRISVDENGESHVYEIYAIYIPTNDEFTFYIDGKEYDKDAEGAFTLTETTAKREVNIHITNEVGYELPKTGSHAKLSMNLAGIALCGISIYLTNKEKRRKTL